MQLKLPSGIHILLYVPGRMGGCWTSYSSSLQHTCIQGKILLFRPSVQQPPLTTREVKVLSLTVIWRERKTEEERERERKESDYTGGGAQRKRKSEKKGHTQKGRGKRRDENPNESSSPNGQTVKPCVHVCVCVFVSMCLSYLLIEMRWGVKYPFKRPITVCKVKCAFGGVGVRSCVCVCSAYQLLLTTDTMRSVCVCKESVNANVCMAYQSQDTPYILKTYIRMCVCVQTRMWMHDGNMSTCVLHRINKWVCMFVHMYTTIKWGSFIFPVHVCVCDWMCLCVCMCGYNFILLSQPLVKEPFRAQVEFLQRFLTLLSPSLPFWLSPSFLHLCLIISVYSSVFFSPLFFWSHPARLAHHIILYLLISKSSQW